MTNRFADLFDSSDRHEAREKIAYITALTSSPFEIDRQLSLAMVDFFEAQRFAAVVELSSFVTASEMELL
jgi:hypothetical protein